MLNPLRDYLERRRIRGDTTRSTGRASPRHGTDVRSAFRRAPGEEWTFDGTRILLNGRDVEALLEPSEGEIGTWCAVVEALGEYKEWAYAHRQAVLDKLLHAIGGVQERALQQLRRVYDEKVGGLTLAWGDGRPLLNNVNVRAMLALYHARPTGKARRFLDGLRQKLALILCAQPVTPHLARVQHVVQELYRDVCDSLATPPVDTMCLPAGPGNPPRNGCR